MSLQLETPHPLTMRRGPAYFCAPVLRGALARITGLGADGGRRHPLFYRGGYGGLA